ncbi:MAG: winged helix-turn-helix transcriptional regulator [Anaeroplasma sp.]
MDFANGTNGPIARNPLINTILYLNKTIESFGTGFGRVFKLCEKENINYTYYNNEFGFVFEFLRKQNVSINVPINVSLNFTSTEALVLEILKTNKGINKNQISKMIGKTEMTVQRAIKKLIEKNLIKRVGSNKTGNWEIV